MKNLITVALIWIMIFNISCNGKDECKSGSKSTWPQKNRDECAVITELDSAKLSLEMIPNQSPIIPVNPYNKAELGKTVNSATGTVGGYLLPYSGAASEIIKDNVGGIELDFTSVSSIYDLISKFSLNVATSIKWFGFNGNASFESSQFLSINQYHEYVVVRIVIKDHIESLTQKQFFASDSVVNLAKTDPDKFVERFGDQVITSKLLGGDLFAVLEVNSANSIEKSSNKTHVDAAIKSFSVSAKAVVDVQNSLEEINKCSSLSIKLISKGLDLSSKTSYTSLQDLKELIANFPSEVNKKPGVIEYYSSPILQSVSNLPRNLSASDFLIIKTQGHSLRIMEDISAAIVAKQPDLLYVKNNPKMFVKKDVETARMLYIRNANAINAFQFNWGLCAENAKLCQKCLLLKYTPRQFAPEIDKSGVHTKPQTTMVPIVIDPSWQLLVDIPAKKAATVMMEGKLQFNHIYPLDCRIPAFNNIDLVFASPSIGGYFFTEFRDGRVIPLVELQYFEIKDGQETLFGSPFFWDGNSVEVLPSLIDRKIKARLRLYYGRPGAQQPSILGPAADESIQIQQNLHGCGDTLQARIIQ